LRKRKLWIMAMITRKHGTGIDQVGQQLVIFVPDLLFPYIIESKPFGVSGKLGRN
jgi:hypothetical protein